MCFFAAVDALPSLESMKFPVFSLLAGNFGLFRDEFGNAPPPTPLVHSASVADRDRDTLSNRPLTNIDEPSCGCIPAHLRSVEPPTPAPSTAASPRPRPASASPPSAVTPPAKQAAPNPPLSNPPPLARGSTSQCRQSPSFICRPISPPIAT